MGDMLEALRGASYCPVCGCLSSHGVIRCPECSTFHAGTYLEERQAPTEPILNEKSILVIIHCQEKRVPLENRSKKVRTFGHGKVETRTSHLMRTMNRSPKLKILLPT